MVYHGAMVYFLLMMSYSVLCKMGSDVIPLLWLIQFVQNSSHLRVRFSNKIQAWIILIRDHANSSPLKKRKIRKEVFGHDTGTAEQGGLGGLQPPQ